MGGGTQQAHLGVLTLTRTDQTQTHRRVSLHLTLIRKQAWDMALQ